MSEKKEELLSIVENLYDKYLLENNTYALTRLEHHVNILKPLIENENKENDERISKLMN